MDNLYTGFVVPYAKKELLSRIDFNDEIDKKLVNKMFKINLDYNLAEFIDGVKNGEDDDYDDYWTD